MRFLGAGFVLEGTTPWELPECLLGTLRLNYLDLKFAKPLDIENEIPLLPAVKVPLGPVRSMGHSRTPSISSSPFKDVKDFSFSAALPVSK